MAIIADFDGPILGDPGENGTFENEPYDGLQEDLNSKPSNWRVDTTPNQRKEILLNRMANMPEEDLTMFLKVVRHDAINDTLDAIKNLKSTTEDTWKKVIGKLQLLLNFNDPDTSKFDFNKLLRILLPLLAGLAGLLIGLRKSEIEDAKSSDLPEELTNDPVFKKMTTLTKDDDDDDSDIDPITGKLKSVVLNKCKNKLNGFS
jgi:hypothetical protein